MRTAITIIATFLYCLSYSWYLIYTGNISDILLKVWVNGTFGLFTLFLFLDSQFKTNEEWHDQFHKIAFSSLIVNFLLIIVFYITDGLSGIDKLLIFNVSTFTISLAVITSCLRHGLFKTNEK